MASLSISHGVGRRKSSVARVWLRSGSGKIEVNGKDYSEYFPTDFHRKAVKYPLETVSKASEFDIKVNVNGGGNSGQAGAARLGIARAILKQDLNLRPVLKAAGLLTVDSRKVERKKSGQKGARAKFQFVKR